jgi:hypothetical protein
VPTTTEEKIAGINKNPCTPGQVNQTITNITNVLNEVNGNGTVMARCTLTSDGLTCAPGTLEVSSFTPLVKDFAALGIATPTEAVQYLNIATFGAAVGYIVYNWDDEQWEVLEIIRTLRNNLVDPPSLTDRTLSFPYETQSVNECDATGVRDVVFSTVTIAVVTELEKTVNGIEWNDVEVEVWATGSSTPGLIPTAAACETCTKRTARSTCKSASSRCSAPRTILPSTKPGSTRTSWWPWWTCSWPRT